MKRGLMVFVALLWAMLVHAQESDFDRLFSTSAERQQLDYLRHAKKTPLRAEPVVESQPRIGMQTLPEPVEENTVALQGYVKRLDGKTSTVWVNGKPIQENSSTTEVSVGKLQPQSNRVGLRIKNSGRVLHLKPGQTFEPESGRIAESATAVSGDTVGTIGE